ncbi:MAG: SurA N-terminal domain-containing protein [Endomicrobium sp.]|jgi:hypothetical protein|nr:SurA N-terminal domain-containing protein [Endomicrobium sp.]
MDFLIKHMRVILVFIIIIFVFCVGFGIYFSISKDNSQTAITINGTKISMQTFNLICTNYIKIYETTNNKLSKNDLNKIKMEIIQKLIQDEFFYHQSKYYMITVTDEELKTDLQNFEMFKSNNIFNIHKYYTFLNFIKMTPKQYESTRKKQIIINKTKYIILSSIKFWNYEFEKSIKQNSKLTKEYLINKKINLILNKLYSDTLKNSKIKLNTTIFK